MTTPTLCFTLTSLGPNCIDSGFFLPLPPACGYPMMQTDLEDSVEAAESGDLTQPLNRDLTCG